jgi:hypothetical protein
MGVAISAGMRSNGCEMLIAIFALRLHSYSDVAVAVLSPELGYEGILTEPRHLQALDGEIGHPRLVSHTRL